MSRVDLNLTGTELSNLLDLLKTGGLQNNPEYKFDYDPSLQKLNLMWNDGGEWRIVTTFGSVEASVVTATKPYGGIRVLGRDGFEYFVGRVSTGGDGRAIVLGSYDTTNYLVSGEGGYVLAKRTETEVVEGIQPTVSGDANLSFFELDYTATQSTLVTHLLLDVVTGFTDYYFNVAIYTADGNTLISDILDDDEAQGSWDRGRRVDRFMFSRPAGDNQIFLLSQPIVVRANETIKIKYWFSSPVNLKVDSLGKVKSSIVGKLVSTDSLVGASDVTAMIADKQDVVTGGASTITSTNLASNKVVVSDSNGKVAVSTVSTSELEGYGSAIESKVDKVAGKVLTTNDFTDPYKTKLDGISTNATANASDAQLRDRSTHTGTQGMSTIVGLDTALSGKVDVVPGKELSSNDYTTSEKNKLSGIAANATVNSTDAQLRDRASHTGSQAISTVTGLQDALDSKVPSELGKGLSTNDFTTAEKTKLSSVASGATANSTDADLRERSSHTGTQPHTTITGLGTGATSTVTTSTADTTAGRLLKVRDFGVGASTLTVGSDDLDSLPNAAQFFAADSAPSNWKNELGAFPTGAKFARSSSVEAMIGIGYAGSIAYRAKSTPTTWQSWREIYHNANILGTVSQSGGVPTGAIIQRGSNPNGEFVRYADGTLICHCANQSVTIGAGELTSVTFTLPSPTVSMFSNGFTCGQNTGGASNVYAMGRSRASSDTEVSVRFHNLDTIERTATVTATHIGRWF